MKLFVTGATGFVGAHFVEHALASGHTVIGLHRASGAGAQRASKLRDRGAVMVSGDVLDPSPFADALKGVDCICHFAGAFRESGADEAYFDRVNVDGTRRMLELARSNGVRRFVYCSTAGVYGQRLPHVIDERAALQPWNGYERSKAAAERVVRESARDGGFEYVILRPTAVYGPRDERLRKLFRSAAKGRFPLFGAGAGRRHMIYVVDLVEAFLLACERPQAANQELILAGPRAVALRELLDMLATAAGRKRFGPRLPLQPMLIAAAVVEDVCSVLNLKPPIYRRRMDFYLSDAAFDTSRAQQVLGWRPRVDLGQGLAATLSSVQRATTETQTRPATSRVTDLG